MGLAGASRLDLAAAGWASRVMPGKPCAASRNAELSASSSGDGVEIDDGTALGAQQFAPWSGQNREYSIALDLHGCTTCAIVMVTLRQVSRRGGTGRRDRLRIYYR